MKVNTKDANRHKFTAVHKLNRTPSVNNIISDQFVMSRLLQNLITADELHGGV